VLDPGELLGHEVLIPSSEVLESEAQAVVPSPLDQDVHLRVYWFSMKPNSTAVARTPAGGDGALKEDTVATSGPRSSGFEHELGSLDWR
jgi:hypothetical protein